jgi:hypothetical protein
MAQRQQQIAGSGAQTRPSARPRPAAQIKPAVPSDEIAELRRTEIKIKNVKSWLGFGVEVAVGAGLVGTGVHDFLEPSTALVSATHAWELIVAGAPLLGAGQTIVNVVQNTFGRPSRG